MNLLRMSKKLKLAVYAIGTSHTPSTRFRVAAYLPYFEKAGIQVRVFTLPAIGRGKITGFLGNFVQAMIRFFQILQAPAYDRVLIQKGLTPWRAKGLVRLLRAMGKPFLFDLDDALYLGNPVILPGFLRHLQDDEEPVKLFKNAAQVIAGNAYLAGFAVKHNAAVTVIPTAIDTDRYPCRSFDEASNLVIGWSGSSSTNPYVNDLIPALNQLAENCYFSFYVMSSNLRGIQTEKMKGYTFKFFKWEDRIEIEILRKFDIGLMPLEENAWARGKCGFKALQYMALGIVPVCSPVGVNVEIIRDGVNGFLAANREQWIEKLRLLLEDSGLRQRMGRAARETVEKKYSIETHFPALRKEIEKPFSPGKKMNVSETEGIHAGSRS